LGLGGEGDDFFGAEFLGAVFGVLDEFFADAATVVEGLHVDGANFHGLTIGVGAEGGAADDAVIDFVNKEVGDRLFDLLARTQHEGVGLGAVLGQIIKGLCVFLFGGTDTIVVVGVNHRAESNLIENFGEQAAEDPTVENVSAWHIFIEGLGRLQRLAPDAWVELDGFAGENFFQLVFR
jgi:hypothetical protein